MASKTSHVIFDLDGVIINAVDVFTNALTEYAQSHGKDLSLDIQKKVANLTNLPDFFKDFFDSLSLPNDNREDIAKDIIKTFYMKKFDLIPGVEKLLKHLKEHNIPMAIATGQSQRYYTTLSSRFTDFFSNYFSHVVCGWDDPEVVNKKPNPDVYIVCANRFQPKPEDFNNILVVEDSLTGIKGAIASGMKTLLINDRKLCDFDVVSKEISQISDCFDEFKPESVGLPPYK